jgi:hypothetical protein
MEVTVNVQTLLGALNGMTGEIFLLADRGMVTVLDRASGQKRDLRGAVMRAGAYTLPGPSQLRAWATHKRGALHVKRVGHNLRFTASDGDPLVLAPSG